MTLYNKTILLIISGGIADIKAMPLAPERGRGSKNFDLRSKSLVFAGEGESTKVIK
jgi:hypothetical protein